MRPVIFPLSGLCRFPEFLWPGTGSRISSRVFLQAGPRRCAEAVPGPAAAGSHLMPTATIASATTRWLVT